MREDEENKNGGSFLIRITPGLANLYWEQILISLISNRMSEDINGVIISSRPKFGDKYFQLNIWHKTAENEDLRLEICRQICDVLPFERDPAKPVRIDFSLQAEMIASQKENHPIHYLLQPDGPVITQFQSKVPHGPTQSAVAESSQEAVKEEKAEQ